jgi:NitT/TauT family transport system permease protein
VKISRTDHGPALVGAATLLGLLVLLELAIRADLVDRYVVPPPSDVLMSFGRIVAEEDIPHRFAQTALEGLGAAVLIALVGIPAGLLLYRHMVLRVAVQSWVAALAAAPLVLAYPLFLVIFGRNAWTIVMMGFVSGLAPVTLKTLEGLTATRKVLIDVGRSLKLTPTQQFRLVLLPAAVPTIFVGLRLGLVFALINIVGLEFLINFGGLGQLINELAERYDLAGTYAAITFVVLVSVLFFLALERTERWLRPGR